MAAPGGGVEATEEAADPALGRLEEEAKRRRERLRALRERTLQNKDISERENKQPREDDEEETVKHKVSWQIHSPFSAHKDTRMWLLHQRAQKDSFSYRRNSFCSTKPSGLEE